MDGLFRCAAPPVFFEVAGRLVLLRPMTLGVLAACEAFLMLSRPNLAEDVESEADALQLSDDARNEMRWRAHDELKADKSLRVITVDALSAWLYEPEGVFHTAFWCLKDSGSRGFSSPDAAEKSVLKSSPGWISRFIRARDAMSGIDLLAGMDWPASQERRESVGTLAKKKFIPWRTVYRRFATEYGYTAEMTNTLTLYTVKTMTCDEKELGGTKKVGYDDMMGIGRPKGRRG